MTASFLAGSWIASSSTANAMRPKVFWVVIRNRQTMSHAWDDTNLLQHWFRNGTAAGGQSPLVKIFVHFGGSAPQMFVLILLFKAH